MQREADRRAKFEEAALPFAGALHAAAIALCRREADAGDLVQETYLRAWRGYHTYERDENLKAWLLVILRNAWIDLCRKRRQEPVLPIDAEAAGPVADPPAPEEAPPALDPERLFPDDLRRAFGSLSPGHRLLVQLCDIHSMSYAEAAAVLGCPIGSVMSGLHNARKKLRALLAGRGERVGRNP